MNCGKFLSPDKMLVSGLWLIIIIIIATIKQVISGIKAGSDLNKPDVFSKERATEFMKTLDEEYIARVNDITNSEWNYFTNITPYNEMAMSESYSKNHLYEKERRKRLLPWKPFWRSFMNEELKRQFHFYFSMDSISRLSTEKDADLAKILYSMEMNYHYAKICDYRNQSKCDLSKELEIQDIMRNSQDYDELLYVWEAWRNVTGKPIRYIYARFIELSNEEARLNGYSSMAESWIDAYKSTSFEIDIDYLYSQIRPLYKQLHAFVRRNLRERFGESRISRRGPIPAHVFGEIMGFSWINLFDMLKPYQNATNLNVTQEMIRQNYTVRMMFEKADEFFHSLGFEKAPQSFWKKSVLEKPSDRKMLNCHATAWDFFNGNDFRIKACLKVSEEDLATAHHEMGHIQYFMSYKNLPIPFRKGANAGFHEAVGDLIHMSMSTPEYLHKIGLLDHVDENYESDINFLLKTALNTLAFLPFGYLLDRYRWDVMRGKITSDNYTQIWWEYRRNFQGIINPIPRSEKDFDPGSQYHVPMNIPYIRYFVSSILQFQFHKFLCKIAGKYDSDNPQQLLHHCDISNSKEAGRALREMLSKGSSVHWSKVLQNLTGTERMSASAIQEYFRPLEEWLKEDNERNNEFVGWE